MKQRHTILRKAFSSLFSALFLSVLLVSCTGKKANDNTLHLPLITDAKTMDPVLVADLYSHYAASMVFEGLYEYHYLKRPYEVQPSLAEGFPEISKDGLTYTVKIKKGLVFADDPVFEGGKGRAITSKDFIYSWLRVADPKSTSESFWIFDNQVVGLNEWREAQKTKEKTDFDSYPAGFVAVDSHTIQIKLKKKYPILPYILAMPAAAVVPREAVEKLGKDFGNKPVGSGPYKLVSWSRGSKITFTKNPNWRGQTYPSEGEPGDDAKGLLADAGKALPFSDNVEYHVLIESQPRWLNFLRGSLDFVSIPKDNFKTAIDSSTGGLNAELSSKNIRLDKVAQMDVTYIAFNMEDPVIKKLGPDFRKAFALALDETQLINLFYNGRGVKAQSPIPPGIAGYDETFVNPYVSHNPTRAKELLAKIGHPDGKGLPEIVYETSEGTDARQQAEWIQNQLAAVGIKIRVNANRFSELTEKINQKKAQAWGIAWGADYPDAENFLQLLYSPNAAPGPNGSNFKNAEYDELYVKIKAMSDSPERRKMINRMKDIFVEQMPWVPNLHRVEYYLSHPWLGNFKHSNNIGQFAKYLKVDPAKRKDAK